MTGAWRRFRRYARKAFAAPAARHSFLAACVLAALATATLLPPRAWLASLVLAGLMLPIAWIDARTYRIPDALSLPAAPIGLLFSTVPWLGTASPGSALDGLLGVLVGGLLLYLLRAAYLHWRGVEGLGLGDVKLTVAAGAWTGLSGLASVLLLASAAAIIWALLAHVMRRGVGLSTRLPFGVTLAPAVWLVWLWQIYIGS